MNPTLHPYLFPRAALTKYHTYGDLTETCSLTVPEAKNPKSVSLGWIQGVRKVFRVFRRQCVPSSSKHWLSLGRWQPHSSLCFCVHMTFSTLCVCLPLPHSSEDICGYKWWGKPHQDNPGNFRHLETLSLSTSAKTLFPNKHVHRCRGLGPGILEGLLFSLPHIPSWDYKSTFLVLVVFSEWNGKIYPSWEVIISNERCAAQNHTVWVVNENFRVHC